MHVFLYYNHPSSHSLVATNNCTTIATTVQLATNFASSPVGESCLEHDRVCEPCLIMGFVMLSTTPNFLTRVISVLIRPAV
jgi:hypothetical protein